VSPTFAVFATLGLILIVPRKVPMWASFLGACLALPLLAGKGVAGSLGLWKDAATDETTLAFTAACGGVFVLSSILTHGGHLAAICDFAAALVPSRRIRAAVMPALVGLVPMPGGAVVSAPLIDRSIGGADVSPADKNLINYWFRHIWEVSWVLYPAVLLAVGFVGGGQNRFFGAQAALSLVLAVAGYLVLLTRVPAGAGAGPRPATPPLPTLRAAVPLALLVALPFFHLGVAWTIPIAIVAAILTAIQPAGLARVVTDGRIWSMTLLALLVKIFGDLVNDTGGASAIVGGGLPLWTFALAAPFMVGFATGATLTFVTVAFPVIHDSILVRDGGGAALVPWLVLGYAAGFVGYLTSPVHMCLVLSTRYFNSKLLSAYARLAVPLLVFLAAAVGLFLALGGRFDT
jgi:integral membrane protein (TIGR00529 family)